ncbi:MAG TPA: PIN domain-containing protein [Thermoanaerobaculia bacterium]
MTEYFADTWFFVARLDRSDSHHTRARQLDGRLRFATIVTHDGVLTEVLSFFSGYGRSSRMEASRAIRDIVDAKIALPTSRDLFLSALSLYESRLDKEYSLVDCMSMTLMRERGIIHVFTNDHHFRQEGFTVVNE